MIHALNDTLFFGFYSALTNQGGLVVTVALGGIETPSGLALARRHAWCSICPIRDLQTPQCIRAVSTALPESIANRGASLRFQSLILGFAGSNNPLSLKRERKKRGFILLNMEVGWLGLVEVNR